MPACIKKWACMLKYICTLYAGKYFPCMTKIWVFSLGGWVEDRACMLHVCYIVNSLLLYYTCRMYIFNDPCRHLWIHALYMQACIGHIYLNMYALYMWACIGHIYSNMYALYMPTCIGHIYSNMYALYMPACIFPLYLNV